MHPIQFSRWLALAPLFATATAFPQASGPSAPTPAAAPLTYRSALQDYRPFSDEKVAPWPQANDTVRQVGGWRAYAKEAALGKEEGATPDAHSGHHAPQGSKP
jgi:hypothetical protein